MFLLTSIDHPPMFSYQQGKRKLRQEKKLSELRPY